VSHYGGFEGRIEDAGDMIEDFRVRTESVRMEDLRSEWMV
jgi:hypothetical protein